MVPKQSLESAWAGVPELIKPMYSYSLVFKTVAENNEITLMRVPELQGIEETYETQLPARPREPNILRSDSWM